MGSGGGKEAWLGNRFTSVRSHRRGGMCSVEVATDTVLGRSVAIKRALTARNSDEAQARLRREATILAMAADPNVVVIYDVLAYAARGHEAIALVLEFLQGVSLRELVGADPHRVPLATALALAAQAASGLNAIHRSGYVHRDIKPSNLFVSRAASGGLLLKVIDLGIARPNVESDPEPLTQAGMIVGTRNYLPPEVLNGKADWRSDVFGLCATAIYCLVGRPLHREVHLSGVANALCASRPELPRSVAAALAAGIADSPADRPSIPDLVTALTSSAVAPHPDAPTLPAVRLPLPAPLPARADTDSRATPHRTAGARARSKSDSSAPLASTLRSAADEVQAFGGLKGKGGSSGSDGASGAQP